MNHHQLPIHKTGSALLGLAARVHAQMPRGFKRTVGDKIVAHCSEMLDLMALANASRGAQRELCLRDILREQRAATVWFRVGLDLRAISTNPWSESVQLLDSIGPLGRRPWRGGHRENGRREGVTAWTR